MTHPRTESLLLLLCLLCASCSETDGLPDAGEPDAGEPDPKCNGHEELCERRYDEVSYAMTHNAMSNAAAGWVLPNQSFGITRQLQDGIRGLMLDTYDEEGELLLCHATCLAGSQPLLEGLGEIEAFLAEQPDEVISIIFENYITHAQTATAFEESGLIDYVYAHEAGEPWPSLRTLIDAGTRLVVFQEKLPEDDAYPWLMRIWDHAWETPFSAATPEDLVCDPNRGDPANPIFLLNHFLTGPGEPARSDRDTMSLWRAARCPPSLRDNRDR